MTRCSKTFDDGVIRATQTMEDFLLSMASPKKIFEQSERALSHFPAFFQCFYSFFWLFIN